MARIPFSQLKNPTKKLQYILKEEKSSNLNHYLLNFGAIEKWTTVYGKQWKNMKTYYIPSSYAITKWQMG